MKRLICLGLCVFIVQFGLCQNSVFRGKVLFQNSGKKPAIGVKIMGQGANPDYSTAAGEFILKYANKVQGDIAGLAIGVTDMDNSVIELVNVDEVKSARIPTKSDEEYFVIVCKAGHLADAKMRYYNIAETKLRKQYEDKLKENRRLLAQVGVGKHERIQLERELDSISIKFKEALKKIDDLAAFVAAINTDFASDLVKAAIEKIENEQNIDAAIEILDDAKLEYAYQNALVKKTTAEVEIKKVIEGYELKISLLSSKFSYDQTIQCYNRIISIWETNNLEKTELAQWYLKIASVLDDVARYGQAMDYNKKALKINRQIFDEHDTAVGITYTHMCRSFLNQGDYKKALEFQQKGVVILEAARNRFLQPAYNNLGMAYQQLGNYDSALKYQMKSLSLIDTLNDKITLAIAFNNIALAYESLGDYSQALEYQKKDMVLAEKMLDKNDPTLATIYSNISVQYQNLGHFDEGLEYCEKSIKIREDVLGKEHPQLAYSYNNLATYYLSLGKYEPALDYENKALDIFMINEMYDHPVLVTVFNNIAVFYKNLGNCTKALEFNMKALALADSIFKENSPQWVDVYTILSQTYLCLEDYERALDYQRKSIRIGELTLGRDNKNLGIPYGTLGQIYRAMKMYDSALLYQLKYAAIAESIGVKTELLKCYQDLSLTYKYKNDQKKALEYQLKGIRVSEGLWTSTSPQLAAAYFNIALNYSGLKLHDSVVIYALKCINISSENGVKDSGLAMAYGLVGNSYGILGDTLQSIEFTKRSIEASTFAVKNSMGMFGIYQMVSVNFYRIKMVSEAVLYLKKSLSILNDHFPASQKLIESTRGFIVVMYNRRAEQYMAKKNYLAAIDDFDSITVLQPSPDILGQTGLCHYYLKDYPAAISYYKRAQSLDTANALSYLDNNMGMAYAKNGMMKEAKKAFSDYENKHTDTGRIYRNWAMYYSLNNDKEKAIKYLEDAIAKGYKDVDWLTTDESLQAIRGDSRYFQLIEKIKEN